MRIRLVRHGQTQWNAERRFLGVTDLPLDDLGFAQADALGTHPDLAKVDAVYVSPLQRAQQTAATLGRPMQVVPDLREMAQGVLEGLDGPTAFTAHADFFRAWATDPTGCVPPGGESLDATRDRALAALLGLAQCHANGDHIVVVTHQMVIASVCATLAGDPLSNFRAWSVGHTGWRTLTYEGGLRLIDEHHPGSSVRAP